MRTAFVTIFGHEHLVFIISESDSSITVRRFSFLLPDEIKANCFGLQVLSFSLVDSDEILLKDITSIRNILMVKKSYVENNFVKCHDELELYAVVDKSIPSEYMKYFIHSIFELSRTAINICDLSPTCVILDTYLQKSSVIIAIYNTLASSGGSKEVTTKVYGITLLLMKIILNAFPPNETTTVKGITNSSSQFSLQGTTMIKGSVNSPGIEILTMKPLEVLTGIFTKEILFAPANDVTNTSFTDILNRTCAFMTEPGSGIKTTLTIRYDISREMLSIKFRVHHALIQKDANGLLMSQIPLMHNDSPLIGSFTQIQNTVYIILFVCEENFMKPDLSKSKPEVDNNGITIKRSRFTNTGSHIKVTVIPAFKNLVNGEKSYDEIDNKFLKKFPLLSIQESMPVSPLLGLQRNTLDRCTYITLSALQSMSKEARSILEIITLPNKWNSINGLKRYLAFTLGQYPSYYTQFFLNEFSELHDVITSNSLSSFIHNLISKLTEASNSIPLDDEVVRKSTSRFL